MIRKISNPDVLETDDKDVARMNIAWQIVLKAISSSSLNNGLEDNAKTLTDLYNQTYNALLENEQSKLSFEGVRSDP